MPAVTVSGCICCGSCSEACPAGLMRPVRPEGSRAYATYACADQVACLGCGACAAACDQRAILVESNAPNNIPVD